MGSIARRRSRPFQANDRPATCAISVPGLDAYRKHHERLLQYVKTTDDDLRNHIVPRQRCDGY